jgi:hypothetical protein
MLCSALLCSALLCSATHGGRSTPVVARRESHIELCLREHVFAACELDLQREVRSLNLLVGRLRVRGQERAASARGVDVARRAALLAQRESGDDVADDDAQIGDELCVA